MVDDLGSIGGELCCMQVMLRREKSSPPSWRVILLRLILVWKRTPALSCCSGWFCDDEGENWAVTPDVSRREDEGLPLFNSPPATDQEDGRGLKTTNVETPTSCYHGPYQLVEVNLVAEGDTAEGDTHGVQRPL